MKKRRHTGIDANGKLEEPNIQKNYIYNLVYQILTLLTPFITTPYISRVLGPEGTGIQSYTNSIAQYFVILAALGTASYGQREIAMIRDDAEKRSKLFWEIELLCASTTMLCLVLWMGVIGFSTAYMPYYAALTMTIIAVPFDISWFFGALEQYRLIVIRNIVIKIIGIAMLFIFVKSSDDLLLYVALVAATGLLGNISMWGYLGRFIQKVDRKTLQIKRHLKPTLVYFIPTIATSIYTILDKAMLGWFTGSSKAQNGYYEYTTGFVNMAKMLIVSYNTVMTARMSYLFGVGRQEEIKERLKTSLDFVLLLAFPIAFGLASIASDFIPWFLGQEYLPVVRLLQAASPLVLIVGLSDFMGGQLLTPSGKRGKSAKVIVAGAVLNFCLNALLIPRIQATGAVIASVTAELFITILYLGLCKGYMKAGMILRHGWKKGIAALVMSLGIYILTPVLEMVFGVSAPVTFLQIILGGCIYFVALLLLRDRFLTGHMKTITDRFLHRS